MDETASPPAARHLTVQLFAQLAAGGVEEDDLAGWLLPHLVAVCPDCAQQFAELTRFQHEAAAPDVLIAATEWPEAPALWDRLAPHPFAEQLRLAASDETLHTWGLCRFLQLQSHTEAEDRPAAAGRLAQLALTIADQLPPIYDAEWVHDLRALALAGLGNARRLAGESLAAEDAFAAAHCELAAGTGDTAIAAEIGRLAALLPYDPWAPGRVAAPPHDAVDAGDPPAGGPPADGAGTGERPHP